MAHSATKVPTRLLRNPVHLVAFGFGSGLAPHAPGTFGTLAAVPFIVLAFQAGPVPYALICMGVIAVAIWTSARAASALGVHDHGAIVIDEFAGLFVSMLAVPMSLTTMVLAVICFRILDIVKPSLIGVLDRKLKGGTGIVMDDVAAGIVTALIMHGILWLFPHLPSLVTIH